MIPDEQAREIEEELQTAPAISWRGRHAPPEAYSPVLPYPLGVTRLERLSNGQLPGTGCGQRHEAVWDAAELTGRFNHWLFGNHTSIAGLARRHRLNATTLSRHLAGKAIMQDAAAIEWIQACDGLRRGGDPDRLLYYWHGTVYRWPRLPATVAGQQANFVYPVFLAEVLAVALWNFDESCVCRVVNRAEGVRALLRSPPAGPDEQWVTGRWQGRSPAQRQVLAVFHPQFWRDTSEEQFLARIAADPAEVVGEYMAWYAERRGIGFVAAARRRGIAQG